MAATSLVGGAAIVALAGWVAVREPTPGALSSAHAGVAALAGPANCGACHGDDGFTDKCLACHGAIRDQVERGEGYHGAKWREGSRDCAACHGEHYGAAFPLVNAVSWERRDPATFDHAHVPFTLTGAHAELACPQCHRPAFAGGAWPAATGAHAPRAASFLGLTQACIGCHEDTHGPATHGRCTECHDQCSFEAGRFDHGRVFALEGAHASLACESCHRGWRRGDGPDATGPAMPFDRVAGRRCEDCHASPHTAANEAGYGTRCERCHTTTRFAPHGFAANAHPAHFPLRGAHATVACAKCHGRTEPLAGIAPRACIACHANPHGAGGTEMPLQNANDCATCHREDSWQLTATVAAIHADRGFPLAGAHASVECRSCHRPGQALPARAANRCDACHTSPHTTAFEGDCTSCHRMDDDAWQARARERMRVADHARTGFPLAKPHAGLACAACHRASSDAPYATRFPGRTPDDCAACHRDPHGGQFSGRANGCRACHATTHFMPSTFGHAEHDRFPLTGGHAGVACVRCHVPDATGVRRFHGTPRDCRACHADPHRGQLTERSPSCTRCHTSTDRWSADGFDHTTHTRFPLVGVHRDVACGTCHVERRAPDGSTFVHYRPLGTRCKDCHRVR